MTRRCFQRRLSSCYPRSAKSSVAKCLASFYRATFYRATGYRATCFRATCSGLVIAVLVSVAFCQENSLVGPPQPANDQKLDDVNSPQPESKRILGIVPNYRTSPSLKNYQPLTAAGKFKIASQDAFDRGTVILAAGFGGEGQLTNGNRAFGQGVAGFAKYWGTSYGDLIIGDYMTEGVFPTLLHQDPRYFRRGIGSKRARLRYAVGQIFWTHTDSGGTQFNYSEIIGNSAAVAISNAYYVDNRTVAAATSKLGMQLGVDTAANILKEFWPDLERKFGRKHSPEPLSADH